MKTKITKTVLKENAGNTVWYRYAPRGTKTHFEAAYQGHYLHVVTDTAATAEQNKWEVFAKFGDHYPIDSGFAHDAADARRHAELWAGINAGIQKR